MTHPTNKEIPEYLPSHDVKEAGLAAPFAIGCGAADAEYTWHDLMASSPLTASYTISWFLRVVSVPRDLQETSSVSYLRARNVIWTAATCRKAGVKPNTLAKVPLLGGKQTHDHAYVCVCTDTHLWNERSVRHEPCQTKWYPMDLSSVPDLISCCFPSTAESARCWSCGPGGPWAAARLGEGGLGESMSHLLGSSGSCLWIQENPFFPMQRGLYHRHEEGKGRLKQYNDILVACHKAEGRESAFHSPPGSGLRWQLSTSGIKSAFSSSPAPPAATDTASTPAVSQAEALSKCPWLAPSSIGSVNGESQLTSQSSWSHTPINLYGAKCKQKMNVPVDSPSFISPAKNVGRRRDIFLSYHLFPNLNWSVWHPTKWFSKGDNKSAAPSFVSI